VAIKVTIQLLGWWLREDPSANRQASLRCSTGSSSLHLPGADAVRAIGMLQKIVPTAGTCADASRKSLN
jgi:hypothetical protein